MNWLFQMQATQPVAHAVALHGRVEIVRKSASKWRRNREPVICVVG